MSTTRTDRRSCRECGRSRSQRRAMEVACGRSGKRRATRSFPRRPTGAHSREGSHWRLVEGRGCARARDSGPRSEHRGGAVGCGGSLAVRGNPAARAHESAWMSQSRQRTAPYPAL
jgi:hypothetical protein